MRTLGFLFLIATAAGAQTAPGASQAFAESCATVRPAAITFLQERGFALAATPECVDCIAGQTRRLHDAAGHRFLNNHKVIEHYTTNSLQYEKSNPVVQKVHVGLTVQAKLHLLTTANACQADLRFRYGWYGAEMILGFPVDGDPGHGDSNGKLEAAYLAAIQQELTQAAVAKR